MPTPAAGSGLCCRHLVPARMGGRLDGGLDGRAPRPRPNRVRAREEQGWGPRLDPCSEHVGRRGCTDTVWGEDAPHWGPLGFGVKAAGRGLRRVRCPTSCLQRGLGAGAPDGGRGRGRLRGAGWKEARGRLRVGARDGARRPWLPGPSCLSAEKRLGSPEWVWHLSSHPRYLPRLWSQCPGGAVVGQPGTRRPGPD